MNLRPRGRSTRPHGCTFEELEAGDLLPLVDALPELMTPASAALGVPSLTEPDEGVGQGWASESTISGVSGRPQGEAYGSELGGFAGDSAGCGRLESVSS